MKNYTKPEADVIDARGSDIITESSSIVLPPMPLNDANQNQDQEI